ncbi:hypothetical protein [Rhizobium terrae]|uniref:hypothetical protein n=1 Tax=Rhizobium terrae TaxID=2171756 RepID=UPI0013C3215B|nr:hypothetical protein [Rhizobium terrae]
MRIAMGELLTGASLGIASDILAIEQFTFVNLLAIDFAYKRTGDKSSRGSRIFAKVPNRHRVCHGIPDEYGRIHVINALTLLYMSVIVGRFMVKHGPRLSERQRDAHQMLNQQRGEQRAVNREMLLFIQELNRQSPALSENE